jgi:hypothetical protein
VSPIDLINRQEGACLPEPCPLCRGRKACDLLLGVRSLLHLSPIGRSGKSILSWAEVLSDGTIRRKEALGVPWRFDPLHTLFRYPWKSDDSCKGWLA